MRTPNFFIVGAPKCGTTAMNDFLAGHPDIFMAEKELHFLGQDLPVRHRISREAYLEHFREAGSERVVGEASVWYLFSKSAPEEMARSFPGARALIMIRNPVDMLHSLHNQHLLDGNERESDPEKAIFRGGPIRADRSWEPVDFTETPAYRESFSFTEGIQRYREALGEDRVHLIVHDDFKRDPSGTFESLLRFLAVAPSYQPEWRGVNERRQIQSHLLHRWIKHPPPILKKVWRRLMPSTAARHRVMEGFTRWNLRPAAAPSVPPALRERLQELVRPEVARLEKLLQRDLQHWLQ